MPRHFFGLPNAVYNDDDVKTVVMQSLAQQAAVFYEDEIHKLVVRYDKCLNIDVTYVEKWIKV